MAFTIECGIVTVGLRFERRFLASPLQIHVAKRFVPAVCPDSRKPPRELLWKTDPKRPLIGLRNHLTESISGILLEQSGEVVRILELTFFFFGGVWRSSTGSGDFVHLRNHTLPLDRCKFSSVSQRTLY